MQEPKNIAERTKRRALSVVSAEGTGLAVSFGALFLTKAIVGKERMDHFKGWVAEKIVSPLLRRGVHVGAEVPSEDESAAVFTPPSVEERAFKLANSIVDMSVMFPVGFLARLGVQKTMDEKFGAPTALNNYVFSRVVDSSVGAATLVGLNTLAKGPTQAATGKLAGVFRKVGMEEMTADSIAKFIVYAQGPNVTGMAANLATLHAMDKKAAQQHGI